MSNASPVRWLQISDLHFDDVEGWERRALLGAMLRHLEEFAAEHPIDLVFVTGDIANRGRRGEYDQAHRFLNRLCEVLHLDPSTHLFVVPGNHDVDRGRISRAATSILAGLNDEAAIGDTFADESAMRLLGTRLSEFYAFTERLLGPARAWHPERPWRVDVVDVRGVSLALLQLNSAWASGTSDDRGNLLVGEPQARAALEEGARAALRVALLHHPIEDLRDEDRARVGALLTAPGGTEFVLRGHLHATRAELVRSPDGASVQLAAGASYTHDRWSKGFNIVEVDLERGEGRVRWFCYSDRGRGFWAPDTVSYEHARDGTWTFPLPASLGSATAGREPKPDSLLRQIARWRTVTAAVYGTVRFIGLADRSPKPNVRVKDVFVPLFVREVRGGAARGRPWPTDDLITAISDRTNERVERFVVLGNPGSGKTTLCRYLAVALSGGLDGPSGAPPDTLALYLPFREYIAAAADTEEGLSIVAYLARVAATHLSLQVQADELEHMLERGGAVLLLDGLDEVGEPTARAHMRDRVVAFGARYPRVSVVATSRLVGYDDASLPESGPQPFRRLALQDLSSAAIDEFVTRWYRVQEPTDVVAREKGQADLLAAIRAEPAAQALARNPLLLTLIALIHRTEARLPGERARLFEKCITTMLETWPGVRRREFAALTLTAQRACLEGIAWQMQERRLTGKATGQILVPRARLALVACKVLLVRGFVAPGDHEAPRVVDAWLDHMAQETGLLVEQTPGRYAFLHLALMEYLAACELDREEVRGPIEWLLEHRQPAWDEVRLLHVGRHAEEPLFLRKLASAMIERGHWEFLLRCIREEACFETAMVERVLDELFQAAAIPTQLLADIVRFSRRHAERVRAWFRDKVFHSSGVALHRVLRLAHEIHVPHTEVVRALAQREDRDTTALTIVGAFWPIQSSFPSGDCIGWAWKHLALTPCLAWARGLAWSDITAAAVVAHMAGPCPAQAALSAGLARAALHVATLARDIQDPPGVEVTPGNHRIYGGLRRVVDVETDHPVTAARLGRELLTTGDPVARFLREPVDDEELITGYSGGEWLGMASCPGWQFIDYFGCEAGVDIAHNVRALDPECYDRWYSDLPSTDDPTQDDEDDPEREFGLGNYTPEKFIVEDLELAIRDQFSATDVPCPPLCPPDRPCEANIGLVAGIRSGTLAWTDALLQAMAIHTGQALLTRRIAALVPALSLAAVGGLIGERTWLLIHWEAIDIALPATPTPGQLALYLALGWSQYTSTWRWPDSPRWRNVLGGSPPLHWLPRVQWHLCWLTADREAVAHLTGLNEALDAGHADPELREIAVELRSFLARQAHKPGAGGR